jgi:hypothetical protein
MTDEIPEAILRGHPDLVAVGDALMQWRRGEEISARCMKCQQVLQVTCVEVTKTLVVSCPGGHTNFRAKLGRLGITTWAKESTDSKAALDFSFQVSIQFSTAYRYQLVRFQ